MGAVGQFPSRRSSSLLYKPRGLTHLHRYDTQFKRCKRCRRIYGAAFRACPTCTAKRKRNVMLTRQRMSTKDSRLMHRMLYKVGESRPWTPKERLLYQRAKRRQWLEYEEVKVRHKPRHLPRVPFTRRRY